MRVIRGAIIGFCLVGILLVPCILGKSPPTLPKVGAADSGATTEVIVEKLIELHEFASLEELRSWLAEDDTDECIHLVVDEDGVCHLVELLAEYDCDDYAFRLQRQAARSGFLMSVTIIEEQGKQHMINLACIGNDIYYIEPQTDEVWFYCHKD